MAQKIEFSRVHAINWFGYADTFDVHGNLLIAGVTGSGKSILMDLVQLVLVGDQKSRYNQSATGKSSSRTLKSYCLGDTKQEVEGVPQYMRNEGATTYAAMEFTWPDNNGHRRVETWGLRIEFDSAAQNSPSRRNGFMIPRRLDKEDWIDDLNLPRNWQDFRDFVNAEDGKVFDTMESYRKEMGQVSHLNFDRETLDYLLPAAMSFTFMDNFNRFCRSFVLPPDEVQISEVRDSYHAFMSLRRELSVLRHQQELLEDISEHFQTVHNAARDRDLYADIALDLKRDDLQELAEEYEGRIAQLQEKADEENSREHELDAELKEGRKKRDRLRDTLNESEGGRLFLHLRDENRKLVTQISQLKEAGSAVREACHLRCRTVTSWIEMLRKAKLQLPHRELVVIEQLVDAVEKAELSDLLEALENLADGVRRFHGIAKECERPLHEEVEKKVRSLRALTGRIDQLDRGKVSTRSALLDAINAVLPRRANGEPEAMALRELCEVNDEKWRPALEIAFTRKFAVVVDSNRYKMAEQIYRDMKTAAPGESLIDPDQALDMRPHREPGCLAEKLDCDHPVAQKIVDHLFGRIICVENPDELRNYNSSILPDGFSYRRPFAERRAHYDGIANIGGRGLARQRQVLIDERNELRGELERLRPQADQLEAAEQHYRKNKLDSSAFGGKLGDAMQLGDRETRLQENITQLKEIEGTDYEGKEQELRDLEKTLKRYESELRSVRKSDLKVELGQFQGKLSDVQDELEEAEEELKKHRTENGVVEEHADRRQQLYEALVEEFTALDVAADQAERKQRASSALSIEARATLVELRKELAREFPVYNEFRPDDRSNKAWEERLQRIQESDIPAYEGKAAREEKNWQNLFRKQVLVKLRSALIRVEQTLKLLNEELKRPIGHHLYQIKKKANPDYRAYQQLLDNSVLAEEDSLFFDMVDQESREQVERVFEALVEDPNNVDALAFLDYRNYYDYDMSVTDTRDPDAKETSVDKQSGKFSGGESQSPYFIAILACYLRAYHRYSGRDKEPSIGVVPIDEAFSKLSGERIRDCLNALKSLGLQGMFSMSSGNIPYAIDLCDQTLVVSKKETRKEGKTFIRNIAVSLARKEATQRFKQ